MPAAAVTSTTEAPAVRSDQRKRSDVMSEPPEIVRGPRSPETLERDSHDPDPRVKVLVGRVTAPLADSGA